MSGSYDPKAIERKWQQVWAEEKTWEVANPGQPGFDDSKPKSYVLEMLPYPSGEPHVGHLKCYAVGDAIAHFRRRQRLRGDPPDGLRLLRPAGGEQRDQDRRAAAGRDRALDRAPSSASSASGGSRSTGRANWRPTRPSTTAGPSGSSCACSSTASPTATEAPVQWCPKDATVLANEQVVDGRCERCGTEVVQRKLEQWFFKITDYAERLLADFELLESWPEHVITMQRNWIGRSEGAEVDLPLRGARPRLPGLHHPARHPLRRHLLRPGPRAPRAGAAGRRHAGRGGGARVRRPRRP